MFERRGTVDALHQSRHDRVIDDDRSVHDYEPQSRSWTRADRRAPRARERRFIVAQSGELELKCIDAVAQYRRDRIRKPLPVRAKHDR